MMKKYIVILFMILGSFSGIKAQDGDADPKSEKVEALKTAFITQKLQLSPDEAQKFWPVYNQYENEIKNLQETKDPNVIDREEKLLNIRKKYLPSFQKVIGPDRVNKLFNAERDFRSILIRRLQNRNQQRLNTIRR